MATISSSVGLVTGLNIADTVTKLVSIQAAPRDKLVTQNATIGQQKTALTQLEALVLGVQFASDKFSQVALYSQRTATSANSAVLSATVSDNPAVGQYQYTPLQLAQSNQFQSSTFSSQSKALGAGSFSLRFGGNVNQGISLDLLNGGNGVPRGKIHVVDHSGATADIDLTAAKNVDDVLNAINTNTSVHVKASTLGGKFILTDSSSGATNLQVQEVGNGTVAAALGLPGINTASATVTGTNTLKLFDDLTLNQLNNGNGVRFDNALGDLNVTFRDGTSQTIDFHKLAVSGTKTQATTTAANGTNAKISFNSVKAGSDYSGVAISFLNDNAVTKGNETVVFDSANKRLTFSIAAGQTTATDIVAALNRDTTASAAFTALSPSGSDGTGIVTNTDAATTTGPPATATTPGTLSSNAQVLFTAVNAGSSYDNVTVSFVNNGAITAGNETVVYDGSNPNDKKLTFQISAGHTTAANIIAALNNDPTASQKFQAANSGSSDGTGLISVADTATTSGGAVIDPQPAGAESSIADVLATINAAAPTKLHAAVDPNSDRIILSDLSTDTGGTFSVTDINGSHAAADLGLTKTASGGTVTGGKLLGGLNTALLKSLNGGTGLGTLGLLSLTNRNGQAASVNLAAAQSLDEVIDQINTSGQSINLSARVNDARDGILLTDTSGGVGNLVIANGDVSNTADKLQLTANVAAATKNSGDLHQQFVSDNTLLSALNGGAGVASGNFKITDTAGNSATIDVGSSVQTVGDLLAAIGHTTLGVKAQINSTGDGITLIDTAAGSGNIIVAEGNSTTAKDLHLLATQTTKTIGGVPTKVIDGSTTTVVTLGATDTLQDLVTKINGLNAGVSAGIFSDGSNVKPFRFTLTSQHSGRAGAVQIDTSGVNFSFSEIAKGQDAELSIGDPTTGIVAISSNNTFANTLPGVALTIKGVSTSPISITVGATHDNLQTAVQTLVDAFNRLHDNLTTVSSYDTTAKKGAILYGDSTTQQILSSVNSLFTGRIFGAGSIQSLGELGVSFDTNGKASLDTNQLQSQISKNPGAVQTFLSKADVGFSALGKKLGDRLTAAGSSTILARLNALDSKSASNADRISFLSARLTAYGNRLTLIYQNNELAIQKIQSSLSALTSIAQTAGSTSSTSSNSSSGNSSLFGNSTVNG